MNKLFWILFLISVNSMAAINTESVILLISIDNRGNILKKEVAIIKGSTLIVNGEKLSPVEIITQSDNIKNISNFITRDSSEHCLSGKFKHLFYKGTAKKEEVGCLSSDRFSYLERSFKNLKKDTATEK